MSSLSSSLVLSEDETLALEIKAKLVFTSSVFVFRFLLEILRFIGQCLGCRKEGYLVVTNKRVVEIYRQRFLWFFYMRKTVRNIRHYHIKEVNYTKKGTFVCFCRRYHLYYEREFKRVYAILKGLTEEETQKAVTTFFEAVKN